MEREGSNPPSMTFGDHSWEPPPGHTIDDPVPPGLRSEVHGGGLTLAVPVLADFRHNGLSLRIVNLDLACLGDQILVTAACGSPARCLRFTHHCNMRANIA